MKPAALDDDPLAETARCHTAPLALDWREALRRAEKACADAGMPRTGAVHDRFLQPRDALSLVGVMRASLRMVERVVYFSAECGSGGVPVAGRFGPLMPLAEWGRRLSHALHACELAECGLAIVAKDDDCSICT